jgi:hypothetical protein
MKQQGILAKAVDPGDLAKLRNRRTFAQSQSKCNAIIDISD